MGHLPITMTKDEMYECLIYQAAAVGPWPVRYIRDTVNWERLNWPQYRHFQQAELTVVFDDLVALSRILIDTVAPGVADRHGPQYRMSIAASQRWEKWAKPNWELFYEEKYIGANKCELRGNNATLLERLLRNGLERYLLDCTQFSGVDETGVLVSNLLENFEGRLGNTV